MNLMVNLHNFPKKLMMYQLAWYKSHALRVKSKINFDGVRQVHEDSICFINHELDTKKHHTLNWMLSQRRKIK